MLVWKYVSDVYHDGQYAILSNNQARIFELHWVPSVGRYVLTSFLPSATQACGRRVPAHFPRADQAKQMAEDILQRWLDASGLQFIPQEKKDETE